MTQVVPAVDIAALAEALKAHFNTGKPRRKGKKGKGRVKLTPEQSKAYSAANDAECIKVFTAAGYKDVQPRVNVKTYGKVKKDGTITGWLAEGRRVKKDEHGHKVGPFNLFHIDQTQEVAVEVAQ